MRKLIYLLTITFLLGFTAETKAATWSDNFNDNDIDENKWIIKDHPHNALVEEKNGSLNINYPPSSSWGGLMSKALFGGDFDVRMQFKNWQFSGTPGPLFNPPQDVAQIGMQVHHDDGTDWGEFVYEFRGWFPNQPQGYRDQYISGAWVDNAWRPGAGTTTTQTDTSGYLGIERKGSTVKTYYSDVNDPNYANWSLLNQVNNAFTEPVRLDLRGYTGDHTNSFHTEWDNVQVTAENISDGREKRYAIILGNGDYGEWFYNEQGIEYNGPGDKDFNILNAKRMNSILKGVYDFEQQGSILLLDETKRTDDDGNLSKENIKNAISSVPSDYDDTVVFYYSGEGKENGIRTNWGNINDSDLMSYLKDVKAKHIDVIMESCNSGSFVDEYQTQIGTSRGSIYASSAADESSIGQSFPVVGGSIFSTWFMDGLTNKNLLPAYLRPFYANANLPSLLTSVDANGDGILTEQETFNYAKAMTNAATWWDPQHPEMFPLSGNDTIAELDDDFKKRVSNISFFMGSPADLIIIDPFGNILSKNQNDFGDNAFYFEGDIFGDGHIYSIASIFSITEGGYTARVMPYIDANPTDTFSLYSYLNSDYYISGYNTFAENTMLKDISPEGYTHSVSPVPEPNTIALLCIGLIGLNRLRKNKFKPD